MTILFRIGLQFTINTAKTKKNKFSRHNHNRNKKPNIRRDKRQNKVKIDHNPTCRSRYLDWIQ